MAKILHVIRSADPKGGGPIEGVLRRGKVLTDMGHTVEVVSLDSPEPRFESEIPIHQIGPGKGGYGITKNLDRWLDTHIGNYDHVVVNGIWQYHSLAVWKASRRHRKAYFVFTHGMLDPWFKKTYPLKHAKKALYWPWAEYRVLRDAAGVLFTTEQERILARQSFRMYQARERVVSYGTAAPSGDVEQMKKNFLMHFPALQARPFLLFLSRIHPKKGCDLLIQAFSQVYSQDQSTMLCIAGPDQESWKESLVQLADKLGVSDRIVWTGMLEGDQKWGAYHASEAFILPSHQENFGIVVAEALACGKPVLISDQVNTWREIKSDGAGLVAADTIEGTQSLLSTWKSMSAADRKTMGEKGAECFYRHFEVKRAAESLLQALGEVQ